MKTTLDLRGMECPKPVIETQKAFKNKEFTEFELLVDNITARENLKRLVASKGYKSEVTEENGVITINVSTEASGIEAGKEETFEVVCDIPQAEENGISNTVLMIKSEYLGQGNDELGKVLMKGFLYTITETRPYPEKVVLLNSAIKLSTVNEETVLHLQKLEQAGTKVYSCGTCLNYYELAEQLKVGVIGNMYDVVESLMGTANRITI
ncbi:MAG: sulfurtransferase-like selenium metabolism protein YedF [Proteocatella sp.]